MALGWAGTAEAWAGWERWGLGHWLGLSVLGSTARNKNLPELELTPNGIRSEPPLSPSLPYKSLLFSQCSVVAA